MPDSNNLNAGMRLIKFIIIIISFMFGVSKFYFLSFLKLSRRISIQLNINCHGYDKIILRINFTYCEVLLLCEIHRNWIFSPLLIFFIYTHARNEFFPTEWKIDKGQAQEKDREKMFEKRKTFSNIFFLFPQMWLVSCYQNSDASFKFFQLTATLLMVVGTKITEIFNDFGIFVDDHFFTPANLMVVIAVCLVIVAFTGCMGAIKESTMLVNIVSNHHTRLCVPFINVLYFIVCSFAFHCL